MFAVLVPLKRPDRAKTRLARSGVAEHQRLAVAFAWDAIAAALESPVVAGVWVVTEDESLVPAGAQHLPDEGDGDLNRALSAAASRMQRLHPEWGIAALCGDLPSLVTADLTAALRGRGVRTYVADAAGTGTSLLIAPAGVALAPAFGEGSAARHAASGAEAVAAAVPTLRLDVDAAADLERALALGVGPHTRAALETR